MDKRIRDRIKKIEKLEVELLSDEEIMSEKKDAAMLVEALQQELLRRLVIIGAFIVMLAIFIMGFLAKSTPLNLMTVLVSVLLIIAAVIQYTQKYKVLSDLFRAMDKLYIQN